MHKKRILIFDTEVAGHHVEYLHHLLIKARNSQDEYIFCVSEDFINVKGTEFDWNYGNNVIFKYVNTDKANEEVSMLKKAYRKSKLLHSVIKSCDVTHIFLISLITFIPFLPFLCLQESKCLALFIISTCIDGKILCIFKNSRCTEIYCT